MPIVVDVTRITGVAYPKRYVHIRRQIRSVVGILQLKLKRIDLCPAPVRCGLVS